jgi:putative ABC transport system ATP-binding protein
MAGLPWPIVGQAAIGARERLQDWLPGIGMSFFPPWRRAGTSRAGPAAPLSTMGDLEVRQLRGRSGHSYTFLVPQGSCLAIMGPSGAGKSLLLRMIADLDPSEGIVSIAGQRREVLTAWTWRRRVVYCPAESGWWEEPVGAHFPTYPEALAARLGLPSGFAARAVARCSTGERQRLALLRALVLDPNVLLLDEPTAALDQATTLQVEELLRERLALGMTLVLVTHDEEQARRLANQRGYLNAGMLSLA